MKVIMRLTAIFLVLLVVAMADEGVKAAKPVKDAPKVETAGKAADVKAALKALEAKFVEDLAAIEGKIPLNHAAELEDVRRMSQSNSARFNQLEAKVNVQVNSALKDLRDMIQSSGSSSNDVVSGNLQLLKNELATEKAKTVALEVRLHNAEFQLNQINLKLAELKKAQDDFASSGGGASWSEWINTKIGKVKENASKLSEKAKKHSGSLHESWNTFYDQYLIHAGPAASRGYDAFIVWGDAVHKRWRPVIEQTVNQIKSKIQEHEQLRTSGIDAFVTVESLFAIALVLVTIVLRVACMLMCSRKVPPKSPFNKKKNL